MSVFELIELTRKCEELEKELEDVKSGVLKIIDKSGIESIYNWGAPLREIRELLEKIKAGE